MISWNNPILLWLLATLPVWLLVIIWAGRLRFQRLKKIGALSKSQIWRLSVGRLVTKETMLFLALALLLVAAAGPRWGWRWVETRQRGLDILVAIDVSRSMDAKDLNPSRIERARRMVMDLLDVADGDRVGLVAFAGDSFIQCPMTGDYGAVRMFLDVLNTDLIPVQGTDIAGALKNSLKALTTGGEGQGKFIVILSDGEDHATGLESAIEDIKKAGVKIIAIGMGGQEGAPIPNQDGSFKKDKSGNVVITKLEESTLKTLASETGGIYLRADDPRAKMDLIYRGSIRGMGTERETHSSKEKVWFERYQWFAAGAFVLLLLEFFISDIRRAAMIVFLVAAVTPNHAFAASSLDQYNNAVKLFEDGKIDESIKGFEASSQSSDLRIRERSLYNLGNAKSAKGDLEGATKSWEEALNLDPQDQQARDNLAWAKKRSEQKKKDKNKNQDQKQDQNKDQDKNQEQKQDQNKDQNKNQEQKQDQNKDQQGNGGKNDQKQDQQNKNQKPDQKQEPSKDGKQESQKPQDQKDAGSAQDKESKEQPGELSKEQAEKLLRMVPDDLGKFYHPPSSPQKPQQNDQDW